MLLVGVRCPLEEVVRRRDADPDRYVGSPGRMVRRWEQAVRLPGGHDLEVDTSLLGPEECATAIRRRLEEGPPGRCLWAEGPL